MSGSSGSSVATLLRRGAELASARRQREVLDAVELAGDTGDFAARITAAAPGGLRASGIDALQVNVGRVCNQVCAHCHVDAGPDRTESMSPEVADLVLDALARSDIETLDITGGAPELCPRFEDLVAGARGLGRHVIDRCNLTILTLRGREGLAGFLAENRVEVVCSLPHYRRSNTDKQRGEGVFERSLDGLRRLNEVGYGRPGSGLRLVLVTNPVGAFLPAEQGALEAEWKREMERLHGIAFDALYTITNMPISRYLEWLEKSGNLERYMRTLVDAFNPGAVDGLMCRTTLSVSWDGTLHDCDFNQMLELGTDERGPRHIRDFDAEVLGRREIVTGRHCFGCTAGAGSSCGGSLS
jgi:radical SAM/Cys-rich protein